MTFYSSLRVRVHVVVVIDSLAWQPLGVAAASPTPVHARLHFVLRYALVVVAQEGHYYAAGNCRSFRQLGPAMFPKEDRILRSGSLRSSNNAQLFPVGYPRKRCEIVAPKTSEGVRND